MTSVDQFVRNLQQLRCPDKHRANMHPDQAGFSNHNGFNGHPFNIPGMKIWGDQLQQTGTPMMSPGSDGSVSSPEDLAREFNGSYYQNGKHICVVIISCYLINGKQLVVIINRRWGYWVIFSGTELDHNNDR